MLKRKSDNTSIIGKKIKYDLCISNPISKVDLKRCNDDDDIKNISRKIMKLDVNKTKAEVNICIDIKEIGDIKPYKKLPDDDLIYRYIS